MNMIRTIPRSPRRPGLLCWSVCGLVWACNSQAQVADPTRPPYAAKPAAAAVARAPTTLVLSSGQAINLPTGNPQSNPNLPMAGAEVSGHAGGSGLSNEPRLTSVMVGDPRVSAAVIDGQVYRVGDRVKGATLVSIDRLGVSLRGGEGASRLLLLSRIAKPTPPPSAASAASAAEKESP